MKKSDPKGWIRGNTKIGPVLEVTTSYLQGKNEVEIRVASVNKDNSHSWVRISHGLNKLVTDLAVFAQMCVASCVAWRPRSEPQRVTSGVARANHDGCGAASPGRDTNTCHPCAASAATADRSLSRHKLERHGENLASHVATNSGLRLKRIPKFL